MVPRHTISHLKAMIENNKFLEDSIMDLPLPLLLKSSIYHKEWAWQANKNATPPIFRI